MSSYPKRAGVAASRQFSVLQKRRALLCHHSGALRSQSIGTTSAFDTLPPAFPPRSVNSYATLRPRRASTRPVLIDGGLCDWLSKSRPEIVERIRSRPPTGRLGSDADVATSETRVAGTRSLTPSARGRDLCPAMRPTSPTSNGSSLNSRAVRTVGCRLAA